MAAKHRAHTHRALLVVADDAEDTGAANAAVGATDASTLRSMTDRVRKVIKRIQSHRFARESQKGKDIRVGCNITEMGDVNDDGDAIREAQTTAELCRQRC